MAKTSFGSGVFLASIGATIDVDDSGVSEKLKKTENAFKKATKEVRISKEEQKRHGAQSRKLGFAMLELSRGAEDFAIGFGINGMQGAIRGATNNMAQMGAIISPLVGTIVGFAGAGVAAIAVLVGMAKRAKEAAEGVEELNTALNRLNKLNLQNIRFGFQRRDIAEAGSVKGAQSAVRSKQDKLEIAEEKLQGARRKRDEKIIDFGKEALDFKFFDLVVPGRARKTGETERAFLDSISEQEGINTSLEVFVKRFTEQTRKQQGRPPTTLEGLGAIEGFVSRRVEKRQGIKDRLSIGNVPPEIIEQAVNAVLPNVKDGTALRDFFGTFIKDAEENIGEASDTIDNLREEVKKLTDDAKKLAADPKSKEAVKRREDQQKKDEKAAKDEESRLGKRRDLFSSLLNVVDPKRGKLFDINERRIAREKQIAGFDIPDVEKRDLVIGARRAATIERKKVFDDEQMKVAKAREKEAKFQKKFEDDKKRNVDAARGLGLGFLPKEASREFQLQERLRRISNLKGVSPEAKGNLRELAALTLSEADKKKPSAQFAGPAEFAKQFQLQISRKTDPVEKNTAEAVKLLKKINASIKKGQEGPLFQ